MIVKNPKAAKRAKHRPARKAPHTKRSSKSRKKRFRPTQPGFCVVKNGTITWTLPRKLASLNKLKSWRSRHGDTVGWERAIDQCAITFNDLSIGQFSGRRMKLEIVRLAPSSKWFLDQVNLYGGCKGLEDVLVRHKYMVDDSHRWADMSASQAVSSDGKYWTIVRLSFCEAEAPPLIISPCT